MWSMSAISQKLKRAILFYLSSGSIVIHEFCLFLRPQFYVKQ